MHQETRNKELTDHREKAKSVDDTAPPAIKCKRNKGVASFKAASTTIDTKNRALPQGKALKDKSRTKAERSCTRRSTGRNDPGQRCPEVNSVTANSWWRGNVGHHTP